MGHVARSFAPVTQLGQMRLPCVSRAASAANIGAETTFALAGMPEHIEKFGYIMGSRTALVPPFRGGQKFTQLSAEKVILPCSVSSAPER